MSKLNDKIKLWGSRVYVKNENQHADLSDSVMQKIKNGESKVMTVILNRYQAQLLWTRLALATVIFLFVGYVSLPYFKIDQKKELSLYQVGLSPTELKEAKNLVDELNQMFPEGIQWVKRMNGQMDIQSGPSRMVQHSDVKSNILIAFHVIQKDKDGNNTIKRYDIITKAGEPIQLVDKDISLWTYQVDQDHINIDVDSIFKDKNFQIRIQNEYLQTFRKQNLIGSGKLEGQTYEIYQTAYLL